MQGQNFMTMKFKLKPIVAFQVTMKKNSAPKHFAKTELQYLWGNKQTYLFVTLMSCTYAAENPMFMSQSNTQTTYFTFCFPAGKIPFFFPDEFIYGFRVK